MSKKSSLITEIKLEDFLKLGYVGFQHRKVYYKNLDEKLGEGEATGEWVVDSRGGRHWVAYEGIFSRTEWEEVNLGNLVQEYVDYARKNNIPGCICVALHKNGGRGDLFQDSYLDKWLTREGPQTYLIGCGIEHLYVGKHKFYAKGDYFEFSKKETGEVYLIEF